MERRINKKIENYITDFKESIRHKAMEIVPTDSQSQHAVSQIVQFVCDYERLVLTKDDFAKRKRVKNAIHLADRCCAKRANGEQCTRRRKDETTEYCGTHLKGTPHGIFDFQEELNNQGQKIEVWAQDIQGIIYYIDKNSNVYQMEDIMQGKTNPKIIAKYVKVGENYFIPQFN